MLQARQSLSLMSAIMLAAETGPKQVYSVLKCLHCLVAPLLPNGMQAPRVKRSKGLFMCRLFWQSSVAPGGSMSRSMSRS